MAIVIKLSAFECKIAGYIGRARNALSLASKKNQRRDPNQGDEEMNIQAVGAELAVAKFLNLYPDLTPKVGALPQYDLTWRNRKVEVKRNHLRNGDLLIPFLNEKLIYILACGQLPGYSLIGFLSGHDVPSKGEWVNLTYGPCWRVNPQLLSKFMGETP